MTNKRHRNWNALTTALAAGMLLALAAAATGCADEPTDCIGQSCVVDDGTATTDTRTCDTVCTALYQDCGQLGTTTEGYETCFSACTDGAFLQSELECISQATCDPQDIAQCLEPNSRDLPETP